MRDISTGRILTAFIGVLAVAGVAIMVPGILAKANKAETSEVAGAARAVEEDNPYGFANEKWQEGDVYYNGKTYRYREGLQTYLIMGVDSDDVVAPAKDGVSGGQSDAMFLMVMDRAEETVKVVSVNRNTITSVEVYDEEGTRQGLSDMQICIQHGFGDGMRLSCNRSVDAVKRLFYNIPISGFYALNMGGIPAFNDALDGITLTPVEDVIKGDIEILEGEEITLNGEEAYAYLRYRDTSVAGSADKRLERQEQYVTALLDKLLNNPSMAARAYRDAADYTVTNIDFVSLVTQIRDFSFDPDKDLYVLPGETVPNGDYEEFHVDEDGLMDIIMTVFYKVTVNE